MRKLAKLQIAGPLVLLFAIGAADTASWALAHTPSSSLLWYLNLEVFSVFRRGRWMLSGAADFPFAQTLLIAAPLALLTALGHAFRRNLLTAIGSNLSFVYAIFLLCSWHAWNNLGGGQSASLIAVQMPTDGNFFLYSVLLVVSGVSLLASHLIYIRRLRARE
jgi:hypothetical protein